MVVLAVIPSRGRPERATLAARALLRRATGPDAYVTVVTDEDDPCHEEYVAKLPRHDHFYHEVLAPEQTGDLVRATNTVAVAIARHTPDAIIGNLGDDHLCRTDGWDEIVAEAARTPSIVYGDDRLQGERLPTAPFISALIVRALGWYALPSCHHMYIDDAWKALGVVTGTLRYVPELVIEHVHPATGAVPSDAGYARADASLDHDRRAFDEWRNTWFFEDVNNIRRALDGITSP